MAPVALAFAVLELGGSATDLGLVLALAILPQVFFLLVGGVIADRMPRHLVMVGVEPRRRRRAGRRGRTSSISGSAEIWQLAVIALVRAVASSFFFPAQQGIVPQTVPTDDLQSANALLRLALNATNIGGAALGGLLVAAAGPGWAIGFDALTYFAAAAILLPMHVRRRSARTTTSFVHELARRLARVPLAHVDLGRGARLRVRERGRVGGPQHPRPGRRQGVARRCDGLGSRARRIGHRPRDRQPRSRSGSARSGRSSSASSRSRCCSRRSCCSRSRRRGRRSRRRALARGHRGRALLRLLGHLAAGPRPERGALPRLGLGRDRVARADSRRLRRRRPARRRDRDRRDALDLRRDRASSRSRRSCSRARCGSCRGLPPEPP